MSEGEKYTKCKNCHQDILESKIFLHEGFCLRNNKLCPECDKVFLVQEYEEHIKTHNSKKPPAKISPISEHRKNCQNPKEEEIKLDENLGLKQCVYCTNMFDNLTKHLNECEIKKMIEEENAKYYSDLEKRKKEDDALAEKLSKEKMMDISKDEELAMKLQNQYKNELNDVSKDEELARKLQAQFSDDEKLAKELQNQLNNEFNNNIQKDEEYARMLQQQEGMNNPNNNIPNNNNNIGQYGYNDEDLYS